MESAELIEKFYEFLSSNYEQKIGEFVQSGERAVPIDFRELSKFDVELAEYLLESPDEGMKAADIALGQFDFEDSALAHVRFSNLPDTQRVRIADIRSEHLGKFLCVDGIVRQSSDVRPQVVNAKFECAGCGNSISILQLESKFKEPSRCTCGWRGKFRLLKKDLVDVQHLKIEEAPEVLEGGEQSKRLSVFLKEDLVEPKMEKKTSPGSRINIYGIVREVPVLLKTGAQSVRFDLILEANNIVSVQEDYADLILNKDDEDAIEALAKDSKIFEKLTKSIAPSIYGHDVVKLALVLQQMGGVRKEKSDGTVSRGDIHILLVGDPGSGKSQMLQFISKAAPKGRFVSGKGASGAGITASVVKDEFLKGWSLEAGALVLANNGIAVVDELDKMATEDRDALHEAMEQQQITISKANIQATLRARTTMLAAANPKLGRFDPYAPIASQIDLPSTLINRFDLIFPIRDIPDLKKDEKIALHVLESAVRDDFLDGEINVKLLRKYIAYVKQRVKPVLTKAAINEIKSFYVKLRNSGRADEAGVRPIPISARQLEALVRLAEASAKIRLDTKVTKDDAVRAIELLRHCLLEVGFDPETGQIDIDRISTGITASTRNKISIVKEIIDTFEGRGTKTIAIDDIIAEAVLKGIEESKVDSIIEQLKKSGDVFEPKRGFLQKI